MSEFSAPPRLHVLHVPGADPERDRIVNLLVEQGDACVHEDPERSGVMPNWLGALDCALAEGHTWSMVVQDDAMPLPGWQQHLERACRNSPEPLLGLTYFGAYGSKAVERGAPYAVGKYLMWGGAIAYHRNLLRGLAPWARKVYDETGYEHDDVLAPAYAMKIGRETALCARAIFDQPVQKSLLNHNTAIRRPALTILDPGPAWSRAGKVRVSRSISPKGELERLAKL